MSSTLIKSSAAEVLLEPYTEDRVSFEIVPSQVAVVEPISSRLQDFPKEVLKELFQFLWILNEPNQPHITARPLSKSLQAFMNEHLYRNVIISKTAHLGSISNSVFANSLHGAWIQSLTLCGKGVKVIKDVEYSAMLENNLENFLNSLTQLKVLEVSDWDMAGKVVLSASFGTNGGRKLENLILDDCFEDINGPLSIAINHLRNLPELHTFYYGDHSPSKETSITFKEIGFIKVINLKVESRFDGMYTNGNHTIMNIAALFPAIENLELVHSHLNLPNFSPFLAEIKYKAIAELSLISNTQSPKSIHQILSKYKSLTKLHFLDGRTFDLKLIESIYSLPILKFLEISGGCEISFDLLQNLLFNVKPRRGIQFELIHQLEMKLGQLGTTFENGSEPPWKNGFLVLGNDWKRPVWIEKVMTLLQGKQLLNLANERKIKFTGTIQEAIEIEKAFEAEENELKEIVLFGRTKKEPVDEKVKKEE